VVSVKKERIGPPKVAVEFTQPAPSFWRIVFRQPIAKPELQWACSNNNRD
jgi:hypothetical protein